jgi:FkbM family methyltransferase
MSEHEWPPGSWGRFEGPGGPIEVHLPPAFDAIGGLIEGQAYAHLPMFSLALDLLPPGSVVVDLGAHLGTFALVAAQLGHRVVAVEASARNVRSLEASIRRNGFTAVEIVRAAVSDRAGRLRFREEGAYGHVATTAQLGLTEVDADTLPTILGGIGIDHVDLVKMDIEGSEPAAISGMAAMLRAPDAPLVLYESNWHTLRSFGAQPADLLGAFAEFGYDQLLIDFWLSNTLVEVERDSFQPQTGVDYLAGKPLPAIPEPWSVRPPLTDDECVEIMRYDAAYSNRDHRSSIAFALSVAPARFLERKDVRVILDALTLDPDDRVVASARWWRDRPRAEGPIAELRELHELGLAFRDRVQRIGDRWQDHPDALSLRQSPAAR